MYKKNTYRFNIIDLRQSRFVLVLMLFYSFSAIVRSQEFPIRMSINKDWKFIKKDISNAVEVDHDDSQWQPINIPHTYNATDILDDEEGYYRGPAWYRKKLFIPAAYKHKKVSLYFEGVSARCNIYVNNRYVGQHLGGYTAFVFDIEGVLEFGKDNIIAIKVDNSKNLSITMPPVGGDFSIFGGIYRDVHLLVKNKIFFNHNYYASSAVFWNTPTQKKKEGGFSIKGQVMNHSPYDKKIFIRHRLFSANHQLLKTLEKSYDTQTGIAVHFHFNDQLKANLWSPFSPTLYVLVSEILTEDKTQVLDKIEQKVGFRYISVNQTEGFILNNTPLKLRGAATHQDYHNLGYAVPDSLRVKDVALLKETGSNFIRISHYPHDRSVYKACDSLGLLSWSEIPGVNWIPYGNPFLQYSETMLKEMMFQNYNSPSVAIWGYHNEIWEPHLEAVAHARSMNNILKKEDSERLTAMAFQSTFFKNYKGDLGKEIFNIADINGFNIYEGWYQGSMETIGSFLDNLKKEYSPHRPIMLSEFGAGSDPRIFTDEPTIFDFSSSYQTLFYEPYLREGAKRPWMIGYSIWILSDFQRDGRKDAVPNTNNKGLLTTDRRKKDAYYYIQSRWSKKPMIHITGHLFPKIVSLTPLKLQKNITIFSNLHEISLYQNDALIGTKEVRDGKALFGISFQEGKHFLKAIGSDQNPSAIDSLHLQVNLLVDQKGFIDIPEEGLYLNIGQTRTYLKDKEDHVWVPISEKDTIVKIIGGQPFIKTYEKEHAFENVRLGISENIKKTDLDPIFQTFIENIKQLNIPIKKGKYSVQLLFTEPFVLDQKKLSDAEKAWGIQNSDQETANRKFNISINGDNIISNLNLVKRFGIQTAGTLSFQTQIQNNEGLRITLETVEGNTILSGIIIQKI
ncbi:glycoside hydrolase family 2 TIM barrel-domain containing protein [Aquimarina celericrescens]|uniref:Glycoside hydrolase family 2 TIM barrel-domain containing protein n=1 Tax=Aquimarina celericrescens TaxID=1964542 RepID=A0ABW5B0K2_9FLAO|nr:hypothetical protein [Aquimarina celericrescens]